MATTIPCESTLAAGDLRGSKPSKRADLAGGCAGQPPCARGGRWGRCEPVTAAHIRPLKNYGYKKKIKKRSWVCVTSVAACQTRQCPTATMPGTFDPGGLPHHTREQGPCWASGSCMSAQAPSARRHRDFVSVVGVAPEARTAACRPHGGRIVRRYHRCSRKYRAKKAESGHHRSCAARRWLPRTRFFKNAISPAKVKG